MISEYNHFNILAGFFIGLSVVLIINFFLLRLVNINFEGGSKSIYDIVASKLNINFFKICFNFAVIIFSMGNSYLFELNQLYILTLVFSFVILIAMCDLITRKIPNILNLFLFMALSYLCVINNLLIIGIISVFVSFIVFEWILKKFSKIIYIGYGDIKLIMSFSVFVGIYTPFMVFLASATSLIYLYFKKIDHHTPVPFGPSICLSGMICLYISYFDPLVYL